jgi:hypothetical protein
MPEELRKRLKEWADEEHRSVNDLAVEVLEQAAKHRQARRALAEIARIREQIYARQGQLPDSVEELRTLREERSERF